MEKTMVNKDSGRDNSVKRERMTLAELRAEFASNADKQRKERFLSASKASFNYYADKVL